MDTKRTFDVAKVNEIANSDDVQFWLTGSDDYIDFSERIANPLNLFMALDDVVMVFECVEPQVYEAHAMSKKTFTAKRRGVGGVGVRGKHVFQCAEEGVRYLFLRTPCMELWANVPVTIPESKLLFTRVGGKEIVERKNSWVIQGQTVDMTTLLCTYWDWFGRDKVIEGVGKEFLGKAGMDTNDAAHNKAVGALIETILGNNLDKAVVLYNRWAVLTRRKTISVIYAAPVILLNFNGKGMIITGGSAMIAEEFPVKLQTE